MVNKVTVRMCLRASPSFYAGGQVIFSTNTHVTLSFSLAYHLQYQYQQVKHNSTMIKQLLFNTTAVTNILCLIATCYIIFRLYNDMY